MSGVGEALVQPNGAVGVPVASANAQISTTPANPAASGDTTVPAVSPTPAAPLADARILAPVSPQPAGGATSTNLLAAVIPSPTQVVAPAGSPAENTAISIVSVPGVNAVPAPLPPGASATPVETSPIPAPEPAVATPTPAPAPPPAPAPEITSPEPTIAPAVSTPPVDAPAPELSPAVAPAPSETSPAPAEPPPEAKSDSIPSAIGSANIFAPAEVQAQETQAEPSPAVTSPSPEGVPPAAGVSSPVSSPSGASIAISPVPSEPLPKASSQNMPVGATGTTNGKITSPLPTSTTHSSTNQGHTTQSAKANEAPTKPSLEEPSKGGTTTPLPKASDNESKGKGKDEDKPVPDTTFVSGSVTFTGAAAISAAEFSHNGDEQKQARNGMSSFAIIGIVGGILVFFILLYIAWFQWRKRRNRDSQDRLDDEDSYDHNPAYDPYGLGDEKHSGFDFIDQPLSSRRSHKRRSGATTMYTENPFADPNDQYQRRLETEYMETWYSDPGDAGLGTARSKSMKWYEDDRRPSYIDGPKSIYHEANDPSDPAYPWPEGQGSPNGARAGEDRDRPSSVPASARTNPGAPPVPPLPVAYRKSSGRSSHSQSRPQTHFTYGDYLTGYDTATSRPLTQYTQYTHDNPPQTGSTHMDSPNTAAMLPWLHTDRDVAPPMPTHQGQGRKNGFGSPPRMPLRGPVAAAMAQTPQMEDRGYQGVIPSFR